MSLDLNLQNMERAREAYWLRYPATSPAKLRWRALTVRHCFHVLPGESILEMGAGSGIWTEHLVAVLRGENPITAAVFNDDLFASASQKKLPNAKFVRVADFAADLPAESFDYVVGTALPRPVCSKPSGASPFAEAGRPTPLLRSELLEPSGVP